MVAASIVELKLARVAAASDIALLPPSRNLSLASAEMASASILALSTSILALSAALISKAESGGPAALARALLTSSVNACPRSSSLDSSSETFPARCLRLLLCSSRAISYISATMSRFTPAIDVSQPSISGASRCVRSNREPRYAMMPKPSAPED